MTSFGLSGKVVMVTGGGSGIGRETTLLAARDGALLAVCDLDPDRAEGVAEEARRTGAEARAYAFDVADGPGTRVAVDRIEREVGPIDGLVACAGISRPERAEDIPEDVWTLVLTVNLTGVFLSCQAVGKRMIARGRGAIVNIASGDALGGHPGRAHYCASKFGVVGLTQTLAIEWGRHGVRVNATAPGGVDTPLLRRGVPEAYVEGVMVDRTPLGRLSSATDQARACLFLLSDSAAFITGVILPVDGGFTAGYLTRANGGDYASNVLLGRGSYSA